MLQCVFCTWALAIFEEIWYECSIHVNYKVKGVPIEGWENTFLKLINTSLRKYKGN